MGTDSELSEPRSAGQQPASPRVPLTRDGILEAAIALSDQEGITHLTMRRLGERLGVEAMSLYRYVHGREDLLEGMTDRLTARVSYPSDAALAGASWQAYLQWFAHEVRDVAVAHPLVFPLVATRHPAAPWLRPPLRSLAIAEGFLDGLLQRGLDDQQAVAVYRSFTSFLLGSLLLETVALGATTAPVEEPLDEGGADAPTHDAQQPLDEFDTLRRLRPVLSEDHSRDEFEAGLESLLNRLDLELSQ